MITLFAIVLPKQKEILGGPVHLVEIDLLRGGTHTTAVPRELIEAKVGPFDYHVSVRRFDRPTAFLVYPLSMRLRLPPLAIPLLPGDPDVTVDLQAVFDRAYDAGPYRREVTRRRSRHPSIPPRLGELGRQSTHTAAVTGEAQGDIVNSATRPLHKCRIWLRPARCSRVGNPRRGGTIRH